MKWLQIVAAAYGGLNAWTFACYGWDKLQAKRSGQRIPEAKLHALALLGGFAGAGIGRTVFRHKTQKPVFSWILGLATLLHAALWGWWLFGLE
jgi:uncharacterized membrane protein YsdA (DUF1294 family)